MARGKPAGKFSRMIVPAFIAQGGERAGFAFIDFFTAHTRNRGVTDMLILIADSADEYKNIRTHPVNRG
jgi:hypothetical protein